MEQKSFYGFCIAASIFLILMNLCINLVAMLGVFPIGSVPLPVNTSDISTASQQVTGFDLFSLINNPAGLFLGSLASLAVLGSAIYGLIRNNWIPTIGVLFTVIFWGSWGTNYALFSYGGFLNYPVINFLFIILSAIMLIIFVGALMSIASQRSE